METLVDTKKHAYFGDEDRAWYFVGLDEDEQRQFMDAYDSSYDDYVDTDESRYNLVSTNMNGIVETEIYELDWNDDIIEPCNNKFVIVQTYCNVKHIEWLEKCQVCF